jgi:hypothetical protein
MNIFKVNPIIIMVVIGLLQNIAMLQARPFFTQSPDMILPAYDNKISEIAYAVMCDDQYDLTLRFVDTPICMYTPLSYQATLQDSCVKTYFLPRTRLVNATMQKFYRELEQNLQALGIVFAVQEIADAQYGMRMSFTIPQDCKYDLKKIVNRDDKNVRFIFQTKI